MPNLPARRHIALADCAVQGSPPAGRMAALRIPKLPWFRSGFGWSDRAYQR